jgi:predicted alpha/beta superfamily hydrolase
MNRATSARLIVATLAVSLLACSRLPTNPNDNTWRFLPGHVEPLSFAAFRHSRPCWVYLPPGYLGSTTRYPVLYVNDGASVLNGGINANRICEDLIRSGEIEPLILVAVSVPDSDRFWDYAPWPDQFHGQVLGGGGDVYVRALRDTLKPEIDRRFRTLPDRGHTGIAGYSLGGLISAYAGFACDSTFGLVGAASPTYDWGLGTPIYDFPQTRSRSRLPLRYYQDSGFPRDNRIGFMEELLVSRGFINGIDLMSLTAAGAEHSVPAWEHRFPDMLRFLFKVSSAPAN